MRAILAACLSILMVLSAAAYEPDEVLSDPAAETRARASTQQLRCLVCQNESIDMSNAQLARDLRILVRERIVAGDTDEAVLDFVVARYGKYVLLEPPVEPQTYLLWYGPLILLGVGLVVMFMWVRRQPTLPREQTLSPDEESRLKALMADRDPP